MKILVTFAVETEFAPWKKALSLRASRRKGLCVHRATIGGVQVDFVVTGMGAINAGCAGTLMGDAYDVIIASGFAGALRFELSSGDIIVARAVQQLGKPKTISSDGDLFTSAAALGAKTAEMLLSVDHVAATAEEKHQLAPFADAADMESYAVLSAAEAHSIPAVAIRAISDSAADELPERMDTLVSGTGRVKVTSVVKYVAVHPASVPAMVRLGLRSKSAAETLAHFLESYIQGLPHASNAVASGELHGVAGR
jgi:adenosylhomocysteine nucleosidase